MSNENISIHKGVLARITMEIISAYALTVKIMLPDRLRKTGNSINHVRIFFLFSRMVRIFPLSK